MKFKDLATYLSKLEKTSSRNEMTRTLAELFDKSSPEEIDKIVYLLYGQLLPSYKGIELNMAEKMMIRAIAQAFGKSSEEVVGKFKKEGDLGNVAEELYAGKEKGLSVVNVYERLMDIANQGGGGSQVRKVTKMAELLSSLGAGSCRFVARIPVGRLRLGFSDMTILDALSVMLKGDKSARVVLEGAFNVMADIGNIAKIAKEKGLGGLSKGAPVVGTPIRPSLAERLPSAKKFSRKLAKKFLLNQSTTVLGPKFISFRKEPRRK